MSEWTIEMVNLHNARVRKENRIPVPDEALLEFICPKSERQLHDQIFDDCERRGWLVMHGAMNRRTHRSKGEEDFIIRADRGRVFWIECKARLGKLSPAQQAVHAHAAKLGHKSHIVQSIEQFNQIVS